MFPSFQEIICTLGQLQLFCKESIAYSILIEIESTFSKELCYYHVTTSKSSFVSEQRTEWELNPVVWLCNPQN